MNNQLCEIKNFTSRTVYFLVSITLLFMSMIFHYVKRNRYLLITLLVDE